MQRKKSGVRDGGSGHNDAFTFPSFTLDTNDVSSTGASRDGDDGVLSMKLLGSPMARR